MVYLTPPGEWSAGISFYQRGEDGSGPAGGAGDWAETMYIPAQFNRLVLFRASALYHRASPGFGTSPESGLLTEILHFDGGT